MLVVKLLDKACLRGEVKPIRLQRLLDSFLKELNDLFVNISKVDSDSRGESIMCLQWLLFTRNLLIPEELYFAVLSGTEPTALGEKDESGI